jgi:hypothetical protein
VLDLANPYPYDQPCPGSRVDAMSDDGRWQLVDRAPRCVVGSTVALFDRVTGRWLRNSAVLDVPGDHGVDLSGDGRFVVVSGDDTLLPGGRSGAKGYFALDTNTGWFGRVTADAFGGSADAGVTPSDAADLAQDGRTVAFTSGATTIVPGDTNGAGDAFARVLPQPSVASATPNAITRGASVSVVLHGAELEPHAAVDVLGGGVTVTTDGIASVGADALFVHISVAADADRGARDIVVRNVGPFGTAVALCSGCLTVT